MNKITPMPRKESPILFSSEMVQALLQGRKTQTRRLTGLAEVNREPDNWEFKTKYRTINHFWDAEKEENPNPLRRYFVFRHKQTGKEIEIRCRYGDKAGDLIWVRETFTEWPKGEIQYRASTIIGDELGKWKPSIHLPKEHSRIWLEVKEITVERLQNIKKEDAKEEGIDRQFMHLFNETRYKDYQNITSDWRCPISSFRTLWQSIHGFEGWNANPWVFVVKFKVVSETGKPSFDYAQDDEQPATSNKQLI